MDWSKIKVISGVLKATQGTVTTNGKIAPLLELGAGFDMDLTARENVFLNGEIFHLYKENQLVFGYFGGIKDDIEQ